MLHSFQVLLIEDDKVLGTSLQKALKHAGIETHLALTPEAAQTLCSHCDFALIVADCMLPRMDGVTLLQKLLPTLNPRPKVMLMTGVFKDRSFFTDAQKKTGALEVLAKPFSLEDFLARVEDVRKNHALENAGSQKGLLDYFSQIQVDEEEFFTFAKELTNLEGRQIPFLISLLIETNWTGSLRVKLPHDSSGVIYIDSGKVTQVFYDDSKSLLGHMLMDLGFVEPDDLEAALNSQDKSLIGQKLIQQLSISPHALELALSEQTALRLSQLINPGIVQLQVSEGAKVPPQKAREISERRLHQLFKEWGESKFELEYLKEIFSSALSMPIQLNNTQLTVSGKKQISLKKYLETTGMGSAVESILKREVLPAPAVISNESVEILKDKYIALDESLRSKNHFEILGISNKALSREIERAYLGLKSSMNTNVQRIEETGLTEVFERINFRIEKAYTTLIDDTKRAQYLNYLEAEGQQQLMQKEPEYNLAVGYVDAGKFRDAYFILRQLADQKYNFPDLKAYLAIARAKSERRTLQESELNKVSPENRQSGPYLLAKALVHKGMKNYPMAIQYFKKSLVYNPQSQLARQEIASCMRRLDRQVKAQNSPLGNLLDGILGSPKKKVS